MSAIQTTSDANEVAPMSVQHDTSPVTVDDLRDLAFFEGLGDEHLKQLRKHTRFAYFNAGEPLLRQDDLADRFYVIVRGHVAIEREMDGAVLRIQEIGPGEPAGFSWSFTPEKLHFTARAIEPVKAVFFYGTLLRKDCDLDPVLGCEMMMRSGKVLIHRLDGFAATLKSLAKAQRP
jgi:CRP-like cAMP-binding protein